MAWKQCEIEVFEFSLFEIEQLKLWNSPSSKPIKFVIRKFSSFQFVRCALLAVVDVLVYEMFIIWPFLSRISWARRQHTTSKRSKKEILSLKSHRLFVNFLEFVLCVFFRFIRRFFFLLFLLHLLAFFSLFLFFSSASQLWRFIQRYFPIEQPQSLDIIKQVNKRENHKEYRRLKTLALFSVCWRASNTTYNSSIR